MVAAGRHLGDDRSRRKGHQGRHVAGLGGTVTAGIISGVTINGTTINGGTVTGTVYQSNLGDYVDGGGGHHPVGIKIDSTAVNWMKDGASVANIAFDYDTGQMIVTIGGSSHSI